MVRLSLWASLLKQCSFNVHDGLVCVELHTLKGFTGMWSFYIWDNTMPILEHSIVFTTHIMRACHVHGWVHMCLGNFWSITYEFVFISVWDMSTHNEERLVPQRDQPRENTANQVSLFTRVQTTYPSLIYSLMIEVVFLSIKMPRNMNIQPLKRFAFMTNKVK